MNDELESGNKLGLGVLWLKFLSFLFRIQKPITYFKTIYGKSKIPTGYIPLELLEIQEKENIIDIIVKSNKKIDIAAVKETGIILVWNKIKYLEYHCDTQKISDSSLNLSICLDEKEKQVFHEREILLGIKFQDIDAKDNQENFLVLNNGQKIGYDRPLPILTLLEKSGCRPKFGCRRGVCHQCAVDKTSGVVYNTITKEYSGNARETIQVCICRPKGKVTLDF